MNGEACIFFDSKSRECHRLTMLNDSPQMEAIRVRFRRSQISDELMGAIYREIDRKPSASEIEGGQMDNWRVCTASTPKGEGGIPNIPAQWDCDGFISTSFQPSPRSTSPMRLAVLENVKLLLPGGH